MTWLPLPNALADDINTVTALLPDGHAVLPAYWQRQNHGLITDCLSGVLVHPAVITPVTVITAGTVTTSRPRPVPNDEARKRQLRQACATATAWTTAAPVTSTLDTLLAALHDLAERHGATIVEAQTHDTPRQTGAPNTASHPHLTYVSGLFDRPLTGPLHLERSLLLPVLPE